MDWSFLLKIGTLVIGVIDIGLTASGLSETKYTGPNPEIPFLVTIVIAFVLSLAFVLGKVLKRTPDTSALKRLEIFYHFFAALIIYMTVSVYIYATLILTCVSGDCTGLRTRRYLAAFIGLVNGGLYGLVGWNLLEVKIVSISSS